MKVLRQKTLRESEEIFNELKSIITNANTKIVDEAAMVNGYLNSKTNLL